MAFLLVCILIAVLLISRIGRSILLLLLISIGGLWLFFGN